MINYVVLGPGFNFWMQEHLWSQPREKRALSAIIAIEDLRKPNKFKPPGALNRIVHGMFVNAGTSSKTR